MTQKTNKIIFLVGIIGLVILCFFVLNYYKEQTILQKKVNLVLEFKGQDPENGSPLREKAVEVSGLEVEIKQIDENGQEKLIEKAVTNSKGEAEFKVLGNGSYLINVKSQSLLSNLYILSNPLKIDLEGIEKGEFRREYFFKLKEEAKRDIERRNHLLIYQEALDKWKEMGGVYELGKAIPVVKENTMVSKLIKFNLLDEILLDPKEPTIVPSEDPKIVIAKPNYYRYFSNGRKYLIIAYPEIDFRERTEPPFVSNYQGTPIYWVGDLSLLTQPSQ